MFTKLTILYLAKVALCSIVICSCSIIVHAADEPIEPLPAKVDHDPEKAKLGRKLFHDTRMSKDNTVSCASCHDLEKAGVDHLKTSIGVEGKMSPRNSPTVYNAVFNFRQFWDGRAVDLYEQAVMPVTNLDEMGMGSWDEVVDKFRDIPEYVEAFKKVYDSNVTAENMQHAIVEFEKTLITANSPFDRFLRGDSSAISDEAKRGYELFKKYGCSSCHQGKNVGGNMFQRFGVLKDGSLRNNEDFDLGRYHVTKEEWDKRVFKVPSLRLAVLTPPYFHDGSVATIEEAVDTMIQFQLGREVPEEDRSSIIEFLKTLPGDLQRGD